MSLYACPVCKLTQKLPYPGQTQHCIQCGCSVTRAAEAGSTAKACVECEERLSAEEVRKVWRTCTLCNSGQEVNASPPLPKGGSSTGRPKEERKPEGSDGGLSVGEHEVLIHLASAVNAFQELCCLHPCDMQEFTAAIHAAQNLIAYRVAKRVNPGVWK